MNLEMWKRENGVKTSANRASLPFRPQVNEGNTVVVTPSTALSQIRQRSLPLNHQNSIVSTPGQGSSGVPPLLFSVGPNSNLQNMSEILKYSVDSSERLGSEPYIHGNSQRLMQGIPRQQPHYPRQPQNSLFNQNQVKYNEYMPQSQDLNQNQINHINQQINQARFDPADHLAADQSGSAGLPPLLSNKPTRPTLYSVDPSSISVMQRQMQKSILMSSSLPSSQPSIHLKQPAKVQYGSQFGTHQLVLPSLITRSASQGKQPLGQLNHLNQQMNHIHQQINQPQINQARFDPADRLAADQSSSAGLPPLLSNKLTRPTLCSVSPSSISFRQRQMQESILTLSSLRSRQPPIHLKQPAKVQYGSQFGTHQSALPSRVRRLTWQENQLLGLQDGIRDMQQQQQKMMQKMMQQPMKLQSDPLLQTSQLHPESAAQQMLQTSGSLLQSQNANELQKQLVQSQRGMPNISTRSLLQSQNVNEQQKQLVQSQREMPNISTRSLLQSQNANEQQKQLVQSQRAMLNISTMDSTDKRFDDCQGEINPQTLDDLKEEMDKFSPHLKYVNRDYKLSEEIKEINERLENSTVSILNEDAALWKDLLVKCSLGALQKSLLLKIRHVYPRIPVIVSSFRPSVGRDDPYVKVQSVFESLRRIMRPQSVAQFALLWDFCGDKVYREFKKQDREQKRQRRY